MKAFCLVTLLSLACCETPSLGECATQKMSKIGYMKDHRANLCFAFMREAYGQGGGPALATVPCEAVEKLLMNPIEK
jgi:hypothetical protein